MITAGRIFCATTGLDSPGAVAIRRRKIVAVGRNIQDSALRRLDFPDAILLPGLIDLHAHAAVADSVFGAAPDCYLLPRGTTTVLSQGDAGADHLQRYVESTIEASKTRVRLAINLSRIGESTAAGCLERLEHADVDACTAAIAAHREHIWGIAVNASRHACGENDPREILRRGLVVAERTGLPILYGMRPPEDWPFDEQLGMLRPRDVVTYCFRRTPHCITAQGDVDASIRAARDRGILFDVGHGAASFSFDTAETALRRGFAPDTLSTDWQQRHLEQQPPHDLPLVMSKLRAAGMPEHEIFAAVTSTPARVLRIDHEVGALAAGMCADLTVLQWSPEPFDLPDTHDQIRSGGRWQTRLTVRGGQLIS